MPTSRVLTTRLAAPIRNAPTPLTRRRRVSTVDRTPATLDWRILAIGGLLGLWMLVVIGRLVQLQVYQAESLREKAEQQQQKNLPDHASARHHSGSPGTRTGKKVSRLPRYTSLRKTCPTK